MNALVSIDVATLTPATVFAPGGVEAIVSKIEAEVSAEVFTLETETGRERIKSVAYKVARSKTALDDMGKELVAGIKAQAATIDAERRTIRERLDALKESVRGPLTAWETAEADRVKAHEQALVYIIGSSETDRPGMLPTLAYIAEQIEHICELSSRDWQEFKERADEAIAEALSRLNTVKATAEQAERDQAELAELRRMKAEREAQDQAEREAKWKAEREAAEVTRFAEIKAREAADAAEAERIRAERQAERDRLNAERAEREKIEAAARAVEQERERAARVKADEERAAAKLAANKKHRAKVHAEIAAALVTFLMHDAPEEDGDGDGLVSAIVDHLVAGRIPHVSITY